MRELQIKRNEAGQRFDKFLKKYLNNAPGSFIYKMLRKKNITLNGRKADGSELLCVDDRVSLFFSEETLGKFHGEVSSYKPLEAAGGGCYKPDILYEDEDMIFVNKPAGLLSQKAKPSDVSINEIMIDYLVNNGTISIEDFSTFKPSVCNRLDRNTSGIISFGKSLEGSRMLSAGFKEKSFGKYYLCVVAGIISAGRTIIQGFLVKDERTNRVFVTPEQNGNDGEEICTEYFPICDNGRFTFLKVRLHTGKTHQIRAHLSSMGHPLIGDFKYGDRKLNDEAQRKYGIKTQLLHAYELVIPGKGLELVAPIPEKMMDFLKGEHLWEPGEQGDLEALHWRI